MGAVVPELVELTSHEADETFAGLGSHERRGGILKNPLCSFGDRCAFHVATVPRTTDIGSMPKQPGPSQKRLQDATL
ncbi:hypothetical protein [Leifsonia sp. A12D58]|uniref:hypothetical protein n=1 Tax=Leifsonia sp. A12D58 TaxID=3397674 RepID=UPI0039E0B95A